MRPLRIEEIGGAKVRRTFTMGARRTKAGELLELGDLARMPVANRNALIEKGFIDVWPKGVGGGGVVASEPAERFVVPLGFGRYDVVQGMQLNDRTLDREAAYALAGKPLPAVKAN
jgi:hypothetical protein